MKLIVLALLAFLLLLATPRQTGLTSHPEYTPLFQAAATKYFPPPTAQDLNVADWQRARAEAESNMTASAKSNVGALGLLQIMPSTGRQMGLTPQQLMDPSKAIPASTAYVKWLTHYFPNLSPTETQKYTDGAYNAGPGNILKAQLAVKASGKKGPVSWEVTANYLPTSPANQKQTKNYVAEIQVNINILGGKK